VISDSVPWRDDLLRIADQLERRAGQRRWTERTSYLVERDLMVGAYAVRRLSESYRLSDELQEHRLGVTRFAATGRLVTALPATKSTATINLNTAPEKAAAPSSFVTRSSTASSGSSRRTSPARDSMVST
jgi:hypothetical protein